MKNYFKSDEGREAFGELHELGWQTELLLFEFETSQNLEILMAELAAVTRVLEQVGEIIEQSPDMITDEVCRQLFVFPILIQGTRGGVTSSGISGT